MTKKTLFLLLSTILTINLSSCSLITVPVKVAGKAATTTIGVAGKAATGGISLLTSDKESDDE